MDQQTLDTVRKLASEECERSGLELISVRYFVDSLNGPTLEILVDHDYQVTMDEIAALTEALSPRLDGVEGLSDSYILDISSGGGEKEIPFSDLPKLLGRYLDVTRKGEEKQTMRLEEFDGQKATFVYFIKGRPKKVVLKEQDVGKIKMGYKA